MGISVIVTTAHKHLSEKLDLLIDFHIVHILANNTKDDLKHL